MKARIKATGEIISLDEKSTVLDTNPCNFNSYEISELEILYENTNFPKDYWQKLEHTYAGMAMQGMIKRAYNAYCDDCANYENMIFEDAQALLKDHAEALADVCVEFAHALVEKMKGKEEK